jgi:molecular chaperone DnaK (HSP70)
MRLGIDFGTTHTVTALVDRGNYPVVSFDWGEVLPSVVAVHIPTGTLRYGPEALAVAGEPDFEWVRSFKRRLAEAGPLTRLEAGGHDFLLVDVLAGHFARLRDEILQQSNALARRGEALELAISVPANASSDQRFLTLDAFRRAGFEVLALLNEPSAAGFEYAHRFRSTLTSKREYVLVFDLGGGTFDASLIHMTGRTNEVVTSAGVARLGGDDFDAAVLALALARSDVDPETLEPTLRRALLDECRRQKEAVQPQTRRLVLDLTPLGRGALVLPMDDVYAACRPLVARTLELVEQVMRDPRRTQESDSVSWDELAGLYVVGGASSFPLVLRHLRERFGAHRVRRSPHPFAATAIGLASFLDDDAGYTLSDCLSRHFGVWRESGAGRAVAFDPIFLRDTRLPRLSEPPLEAVRRYRPAHNMGHFRYVECGGLRAGVPDGPLTPWDEIRFPFDARLRELGDLSDVPVWRLPGEGPWIEERYACTAAGTFEVTLTALEDGYSRRYTIGRRSGGSAA